MPETDVYNLEDMINQIVTRKIQESAEWLVKIENRLIAIEEKVEYIENRLTGVREDQQRIIGVLEKVEIGLGR